MSSLQNVSLIISGRSAVNSRDHLLSMATISDRNDTSPPPLVLPVPDKLSSESPSKRPSFHVLASLKKHLTMASLLAFAALCISLAAAWVLGAPKYSATATIFVSPKFVSNLGDGSEQKFESTTQYRDYVQQNVRTINRFDIVLEALKRLGPLNSSWSKPGEPMELAALRLQSALVVEQVPDTYQITITLESKEKRGLAELVNSVAAIYLEKAKSEEFYDSDQRVQSLLAERTRLQREMDDKQIRRLAIAQQLGVSSFTDNYLNPYDSLLVSAKEAQLDARKDEIQADSQLSALDEKQRAGGSDSLKAYALEQANKDPAFASFMTNINARREQLLASLSGLAADHPGRRAIERELADIEKERQTAYQRQIDSFSAILLDQRRADSYRAGRVEKKLTAEVNNQASQAAWFTKSYQEGIQLGLDVDGARKRYDAIQQRIDFFSLEKTAPGFVRLFSSARTPDFPVKGGRKRWFGILLLAGIAVAILLPAGIDYLDPRLHSPRDVETLLGFPPIAWLMEKSEAGPEFAHEQVLRLANRISQDQQISHSRVFAFTSVKARGGTSSIVVETARALAQLGIPALAVEANAFRSDPRYRPTNSRGLTVLLTSNHTLRSEVIPADGEMPDRIPVGDLLNEKNLPDIQNLVRVLRQAAEAYPVVLVDIPPILVSVDAEFIARSADVVVLVIEAESVTKTELRRAAKSLERIHVPAVSALLNRVRGAEAGGFANAALHEFQTGAAKTPPRWFSPWLWGSSG